MNSTLIKNARVVNEGKVFESDVLLCESRIEKIASAITANSGDSIVDAKGSFLLPGAIDDQVHFREPGLTLKATIYSESRAAVAGGVTSFMEMSNTVSRVFSQALLEDNTELPQKLPCKLFFLYWSLQPQS